MNEVVSSRNICKSNITGHHKWIIAGLYDLNEDISKPHETTSISTFFLRCYACNMVDNTRKVMATIKIVSVLQEDKKS